MRSVQRVKFMWLFLMFRISLLRMAVSNARVMIRPMAESSTRHSSSPSSKHLVRPLSTFGRDTSGIGFLGIAIPQSFATIVKTQLRITSSRFSDAGETVFRRISLYFETSCGERLISLRWPRCFFRC